jgi:hypothetical protein
VRGGEGTHGVGDGGGVCGGGGGAGAQVRGVGGGEGRGPRGGDVLRECVGGGVSL